MDEKPGRAPPADAPAAIVVKAGGRKYAFDKAFTRGEQIGKGSTALVYRATRIGGAGGGEEVAAKVLDKAKFTAEEVAGLLKEADILRELPTHPNIIKFHALYNDGPEATLVLELIGGGDVFDRLCVKRQGCYKEPDARALVKTLIVVLGHLEAHGIVHRDLKLASLMLRSKGSDSDFVSRHVWRAVRKRGKGFDRFA